MSNANQLFLLADHVKLSLLERQRAQSLNLDSDTQDGHISRSLDQFRDGIAALEAEQARLEQAGDASAAKPLSDALPALQKQLDDLTSQFHGFSSVSAAETLATPNDPSLAPDFAHATSVPGKKPPPSKTVRFRDASAAEDADLEAQLFERYRDNPPAPGDGAEGYREDAEGMTNTQIHAYHDQIIREQDDHLDRLGESIGRQRQLSERIGDELDGHVELLDETDRVVDRHQSALDRARRQVARVTKSAGENKQMTIIVVLIIILVLLIAVLK